MRGLKIPSSLIALNLLPPAKIYILKRVFKQVFLTLSCCCLLNLESVLGLTVNADLSSDTTWTTADSPVEVTDTAFVIADGVTLTIDPGVTVKFAGGVTVKGQILANGTSGSPIVFNENSVGSKWGGLSFSRELGNSSQTFHSIFQYVQFLNFNGVFATSTQSVTLSYCTLNWSGNLINGTTAYANNLASYPDPTFTIENSTITYATSSANAQVRAFIIDGMNTILTGNTFDLSFSGATDHAVAFLFDVSNTDDFTFTATNNNVTITSSNASIDLTSGFLIDDGSITTALSGNTVSLTAPHALQIFSLLGGTITSNILSATSSAGTTLNGSNTVQGIVMTAVNSADVVRDNKVTLTTDTERNLVGMYAQAGTYQRNRLIFDHTGNAGSVTGIRQMYYESTIINNTISIDATSGLSVLGVYADTAYNPATPMTLKNNIFMGNNGTSSIAVRRTDSYLAAVQSSYNLFFNFETIYSGTIESKTGDVTGDPVFSNSELQLGAGSPGLDAGDWATPFASEPAPNGGRINLGAFGGTASARSTVTIVAPEITTQSGADFSTSNPTVTLSGNTSASSAQVFVNNLTTGVTYTAGQTTWTYTSTVSSSGTHLFSVKARDASNNDSAADTISVTYTETASESDDQSDDEDTSGENGETGTSGTSSGSSSSGGGCTLKSPNLSSTSSVISLSGLCILMSVLLLVRWSHRSSD